MFRELQSTNPACVRARPCISGAAQIIIHGVREPLKLELPPAATVWKDNNLHKSLDVGRFEIGKIEPVAFEQAKAAVEFDEGGAQHFLPSVDLLLPLA